MRKEMKMKLMPWLMIVFGFFTLNMFQGVVAITCMVVGITMLLDVFGLKNGVTRP